MRGKISTNHTASRGYIFLECDDGKVMLHVNDFKSPMPFDTLELGDVLSFTLQDNGGRLKAKDALFVRHSNRHRGVINRTNKSIGFIHFDLPGMPPNQTAFFNFRDCNWGVKNDAGTPVEFDIVQEWFDGKLQNTAKRIIRLDS